MMGTIIDLTGNVYTRLTVVSMAPRKGKHIAWNCICECGNTTVVRGDVLKIGHTKSCGCLDVETKTKHGMNRTPTHKTWCGMRQRCNNPNEPSYKYYGARGIEVCDRWQNSFENFYADMGKKPKGKSLDRIDNNGNYSPENCRWATHSQQMLNRGKLGNNTSGYTGVNSVPNNKWRASIRVNGVMHNLGAFHLKEDAIKARKAAESKYNPK